MKHYTNDLEQLLNLKQKKILLSKRDDLYLTIPLRNIYYIQFSDKVAYAYDKDGRKQMVMGSLNKLEETLPTSMFFRVNRNCMVNVNFIESFWPVKNGQIQILLRPPHAEVQIITSRAKSAGFKKWAAEF